MSNQFDIESYLHCLNGIRRAEPKPFFTGRVLAKLAAESDPKDSKVRTYWGWSVTVLTIIVLVNILLMATRPDPTPSFASEYEQTTPDWVMEYTANPSTPIYSYPNK